MNRLFIYVIVVGLGFLTVNCDDINSFHEEYLENGETIYIAKVDSVDAFSGDQRVLLRLYTRNPTIKTFTIYWDQRADSIVVPAGNHVESGYFDLVIGDQNQALEEKSYVFDIFTRDDRGNRSIRYEVVADIFGERYRSGLQNHYYQSANFDRQTSMLEINWFPSVDETEIAVEFQYRQIGAEIPKSERVDVADLGTSISLLNVDPEYPVSYRTLFLPVTQAIDTFVTDYVQIELYETVNVALNKPVRVSDVLGAYEGHFAVDGIFTNASRWVSTTPGEHWIEIDLEDAYDIFSFATWSGANGNFLNPIPNFIFQIDADGSWQDIVTVTGNTNPQYRVEFGLIRASKVRYFVPNNTDNARLYEIAVYAKIKVGP